MAAPFAIGLEPMAPRWLTVDEDEPQGVEFGLEFEPGLPPRGYVRARLLAGVRRLF